MIFLCAVTVTLTHENPHSPLVERAYHAHGAIYEILYQANSKLGVALHEKKEIKPLAVSVIDGNAHFTRLRISICTALGIELLAHIVSSLWNAQIIRLGSVKATIFDVHENDTEWGGLLSLTDLTHDSHHPRLRLQFISPTGIRIKHNGKPFIDRILTASKVIEGIGRRWEKFGGFELPNGLSEYVSDPNRLIEVCTLHYVKPFYLGRLKVHASRGEMCLQCVDPDPVYVQALNILVRFAHFSGVGYHTTQGMGLVKTSLEGTSTCV